MTNDQIPNPNDQIPMTKERRAISIGHLTLVI